MSTSQAMLSSSLEYFPEPGFLLESRAINFNLLRGILPRQSHHTEIRLLVVICCLLPDGPTILIYMAANRICCLLPRSD